MTTISNKTLKSALQVIMTSNICSIRANVAREALACDNIANFFSDLSKHTCSSGMITSLIYYSATHNFYDRYYNEIEKLREEYEDNTGQALQITGDLKNFLAWFAFEETAYQMTLDLGLEV